MTMSELELAYEECRLITRREAKNFYYAFLTLPADRRRAIYVAYTFCRHCDDSVDAERSIDEKLMMLSQLRQKLDQTYHGQADEPVFLGLADVAERYNIPQEYFQEVLSGVESDLVKNRYQNFEELRQYCYQVATTFLATETRSGNGWPTTPAPLCNLPTFGKTWPATTKRVVSTCLWKTCLASVTPRRNWRQG